MTEGLTTIDQLRGVITDFQEQRPILRDYNAAQFVVALNIVLEAAEIMEVEKLKPALEDAEYKEQLGKELVDVMWYVLVMADQNGIDIGAAFKKKAAENNDRFPAEEFREGNFIINYYQRKKQNGER